MCGSRRRGSSKGPIVSSGANRSVSDSDDEYPLPTAIHVRRYPLSNPGRHDAKQLSNIDEYTEERMFMTEKLHLTLACGDYESIYAIKEGMVKPDGIELTVLTEMDSSTRHWRMIRHRAFDICELSGASYILGKSKGEQDFTAIPVFLHRRFRHGFVFVNAQKGIEKPTDLIGRKIGLKTFQATALVWIRGILEDEFDLPYKTVKWRLNGPRRSPTSVWKTPAASPSRGSGMRSKNKRRFWARTRGSMA